MDADYKFLYVDVGASGRAGDAGVFNNSPLKNAMDQQTLNTPTSGHLIGTVTKCSYHFIGDDAFSLRRDLMKPFLQRHLEREKQEFNYRYPGTGE